MAIDVSNKFPYKDFSEVYIDNVGYFVKIPKIFIKCETDPLTSFITRKISNVKIKGFHCHPSFMFNGHEQNYLLIGKYITRGTVANPTSTPLGEGETDAPMFTYEEMLNAIQNLQTAQNDLTFHPYNIYDHHLLALLMLIEYSTTNVFDEIKEDYHGIKNYCGYLTNPFCWIYGLKKAKTNNHIEILNNFGNPNIFVDTEIISGTDITPGNVVTVQDKVGDGYDFNDIFIAKSTSTLSSDSSYNSTQNFSDDKNADYGAVTTAIFGGEFINMLLIQDLTQKIPFRISKFSN